MPKYELSKDHYLNNRFYRAGDQLDWSGPPSRAMVPLDAAAEARCASLAGRSRRIAGMPHRSGDELAGDRPPFASANVTQSDADAENLPGPRAPPRRMVDRDGH